MDLTGIDSVRWKELALRWKYIDSWNSNGMPYVSSVLHNAADTVVISKKSFYRCHVAISDFIADSCRTYLSSVQHDLVDELKLKSHVLTEVPK